MAGSINHCLDDNGNYRGHELLENMGDMIEGVEEMMFVILSVKHTFGGDLLVTNFQDHYYRCLRGESPWPEFMRPGIESNER